MFENGLLHLTNWTANVIMPTVSALFAAAAIYRFSKAQPYSHMSYAALAALMCSGLLRALEAFAAQAGANDPDRYWISILTLTNCGRERDAARSTEPCKWYWASCITRASWSG